MTLPRYEENRQRAREFVAKWLGERRERAEKDSFWNDLLHVFGVERRQVARFEAVAQRYSTGRSGFIDLFWPGRLLVEHKSRGSDLDRAMEQALDYLPGMQPEDVPAIVVVCDFDTFVVRDMESGTTERFALKVLPLRLELFGLLDGRDRRRYDSDESVNLAATELLARFGEVLETRGYPDHQRRMLLTRVVFCLFADDAGVWPLGAFEDFLRLRTRSDGSDLGAQLEWLFQVLDKPEDCRTGLPEDMLDFSYINGGIFRERLDISQTNAAMRETLIAACRFNWSRISPAIFGSMFQNVMTKEQRRNLGAHYTSEKNILRLIRPLFLDELESELARARSTKELRAYRDKLAMMKFFDPACGCGNFLIVTYREVRRLETECLVKLRAVEATERRKRAAGPGQQSIDVSIDSKISVRQFFGIEIDEWPCRIAEVAMHIAAHLADLDLSAALGGGYYAHFPIEDVPAIHHGNALRMGWNEVLPADMCNYIMGNPPFIGFRLQSTEQKADQQEVWGARQGVASLDYVTNWFLRASRYIRGRKALAAFVATNSVTQGEQPAILWRALGALGINIRFAHRPFAWSNDASGQAGVHVVIVGFQGFSTRQRTLFRYPTVRSEPVAAEVGNINAYLVDGPDVLISAKKTPPTGLPTMRSGNVPRDGGYLSKLTSAEVQEIRERDPIASEYLRRIYGSVEHVHSQQRWCLWLIDALPQDIRRSPELLRRVTSVQEARRAAGGAKAKAAATPHLFATILQPRKRYLLVPSVSSEARPYVPLSYYEPDDILTNAAFAIEEAPSELFGMMSSRVFTAWVSVASARLLSGFQISSSMVYNTFPWPNGTEWKSKVSRRADAVLAVRAKHDGASLADLYDKVTMPADLRKAHHELDVAALATMDLKPSVNDDQLIVKLLEYYQAKQC